MASNNLKLPKRLKAIVRHGIEQLSMVRDFAHEVHEYMLKKEQPQPNPPLSQEELIQLGMISTVLRAMADKKELAEVGLDSKATVSVRVFEFAKQLAIVPLFKKQIFADMALVTLNSQMESVIKEYLAELLAGSPALLRTSATITVADTAKFKSMRDLHRSIAEKDVDSLMFAGLVEVSEFFLARLKIDLTLFPEWIELGENASRRNTIVHNGGRADERYRRSVKAKPHLSKVKTNLNYVNDAASRMIRFIEFIDASVRSKARKIKKNK
ncbi:hypothetical protein [Dyella sp. 20L07]|uniref:hypothetical protein n=1 Tax=Dyella sp. 20L07 TaxID=3384240 RepID=UPI003D2A9270